MGRGRVPTANVGSQRISTPKPLRPTINLVAPAYRQPSSVVPVVAAPPLASGAVEVQMAIGTVDIYCFSLI